MHGPRSPAGCHQSAAPPHAAQSFQVREEDTLTVLRCSEWRQEIPVTVIHNPDSYFIKCEFSLRPHARTDSSWRNFQSWKILLYSSSWNIQINRLMESERTLGKIKNMFHFLTVTLSLELQQLVTHCPLQVDWGNVPTLELLLGSEVTFPGQLSLNCLIIVF